MFTSLRVAAVAILSTAALPFLSANPASAVVVYVGGNSYDVTTLNTTYEASTNLFQGPPTGMMPWWGNDLLASEFAAQVYDSLGSGWDADYGPVFAHGQSVGQVLGLAQSITDPLDQIDVTPATNTTVTYAIATSPVPGPLPLVGAAAALGWSRQLKKRMEKR
ncbi:MAG: hypothetical protein ACK587_10780 [Cyanobacteriota bacterium]|jgi:hypothetical protein